MVVLIVKDPDYHSILFDKSLFFFFRASWHLRVQTYTLPFHLHIFREVLYLIKDLWNWSYVTGFGKPWVTSGCNKEKRRQADRRKSWISPTTPKRSWKCIVQQIHQNDICVLYEKSLRSWLLFDNVLVESGFVVLSSFNLLASTLSPSEKLTNFLTRSKDFHSALFV